MQSKPLTNTVLSTLIKLIYTLFQSASYTKAPGLISTSGWAAWGVAKLAIQCSHLLLISLFLYRTRRLSTISFNMETLPELSEAAEAK